MADHAEDRLRALVAAADPMKQQYPGVYGKNVERLNVALRNNADALLDVVAAFRVLLASTPQEVIDALPSELREEGRPAQVALHAGRDALARLDTLPVSTPNGG